jgi:hypothetical protein
MLTCLVGKDVDQIWGKATDQLRWKAAVDHLRGKAVNQLKLGKGCVSAEVEGYGPAQGEGCGPA